MDLTKLKVLAQRFVENFDNLEFRVSCADYLKVELNGLEQVLRERDTEKYLKRAIIVLHDVIRINPAAKMKLEQAELILNIINEILSKKKLKREEFLRICRDIRSAKLYILPVTSEVHKTAEEVFGKEKK